MPTERRTARRPLRRLLVLLAALVALPLIGASNTASAAAEEAENPLEPLDTSSPQATYVSFLEQMEIVAELLFEYEDDRTEANQLAFSGQLAKAGDVFDLSQVPESNRSEALSVSVASLADILNRVPRPDVDEIPDADDVAAGDASVDLLGGRLGGGDEASDGSGDTADSADDEVTPTAAITEFTLPGTEIRIVRLTEGARAGDFVFSSDTVASLPGWRDAVDDLPVREGALVDDWVQRNADFTGHLVPRGLVDALPDSFDRDFLGSPFWKFVVDLVLLAFVAGVALLWDRLVARRGRPGSAGGYLLRLTTPLLIMVSMALARRFMDEQVNHGGDVAVIVNVIVTLTIWTAMAWGFWLAVRTVVEWTIATPTISDDSVDAHLLRLIGKVTSVIGVVGIVMVGFSRVGISAVGLGIGAGVAGLAVALAATSTLENLIGGITVYADKPFAVGDKISVDGDYGTVEAIGPRSTRMRRLDDTLVNLPNSDISRARVTNFSARGYVLFNHLVGVRYETTLDQLKWIVETTDARFREHPMVLDEAEFPRIHVAGFGSSSIDIEVQAHVATSDWNEYAAVREDLLYIVFEVVEEAGSGFAFPSTTTYLADDGGLPERVAAALSPAASDGDLESGSTQTQVED